jgi:hypothetical protein
VLDSPERMASEMGVSWMLSKESLASAAEAACVVWGLVSVTDVGGAFSSMMPGVNCHIKCDWQWFWPNYVRLSFPHYLRLGEKIQETGLLVSLVADAARRPIAWSGRASLTGMRARWRFPTSRAIMASNPVLSTTTKRRFRQRIVLPGVKATETAITVLGMRGLKNQTIPARLPPIFSRL